MHLSQDALSAAYATAPSDKRDKNLIASVIRAYVDALHSSPDGWIVQEPGKKRRLIDADKYDAESPDFWVDGKIPEGTTVTPLYRPHHSAPDGEDLSHTPTL